MLRQALPPEDISLDGKPSPDAGSGGGSGGDTSGEPQGTATPRDQLVAEEHAYLAQQALNAARRQPTEYGGAAGLRSSGTDKTPVVVTQIAARSRVSDAPIRIQSWLGLVTRPNRDNVPLGALADMKNLRVNKVTGALTLRTGSSAFTLPSVDVSGTFTPTTGSHNFLGEFGVEVPSTTAHVLSYAQDAGAVKGILQTNFFPNSSTVNSGAVKWGETKTATIDSFNGAHDVIAVDTSNRAADYYKYWIAYNSSQGSYCMVASSSSDASFTTLTLLEETPSTWGLGDNITLYRHFHDNPTFAVTYTTPVALQLGQGILFSGGQSSTAGCKACISQYISGTWFSAASVTMPYAGTHIAEAEVKSTAGISPQAAAAYTATGAGLNTAYRWFIGFIPETSDGIRGQLITNASNYVTPTTDQGIQAAVRFTSQLNKRIRYLHVVAGYSADTSLTDLPYAQYFFVKTIDLFSDSGITYVASTTTPGYWTKTAQVSNTDWTARGEDLVTFLGHAEADNTTVSFSKAVAVNGRIFLARYYDFTAAKNYDDSIRYNPVASNGVIQLTVWPNLPDVTESQVEPGDPAVIRGIARYQDKLFIVKDNSCYYIAIDPDPTLWQLVTIARVGSDVEGSVVATPFGVCWVKTGEDIYLWDGGYPRPLTRHWKNTYAALTPATGWYEWETKTYNFFADYGNSMTWYSMSFDSVFDGEYAWTKHVASSGLVAPAFSGYDSDLYPVFTVIDDTTRLCVRMISSATTDRGASSGYGIAPYFQTAPIVLDERHVMKVKEWHLALESIAGASGTLTCTLTTTGAAASGTQTYSNISKSETLHIRKCADTTGRGRVAQYAFNTVGATYTGLQIDELGLTYDLVKIQGDSVKTS